MLGDLRRRAWLPLTLSTVTFAPLLLVVGVVVSLNDAAFVDGYWLDLSSKSTISLLFLAPGFAALCAWDASRWRTLMSVSARPWTVLLCWHLMIVALTTALTFVVTLMILWAQTPPSTGLPRVDVLAAGVLSTVAYAAVGFVLGRFLPKLVATALAFGLVWLWVAYTPAIQPFWLRNITGNLGTSCCSLDVQLPPHALLAPGLVAVALLILAFAVSWHGELRLTWAASVVVLGVAVASAAQLMSSVGADPVQRRTGEQVCRTSQDTTWCAWPEHAEVLGQAVPHLAATTERLRAVGLRVPERLREDQAGAGGWQFSLGADSPTTWTRVLATSPLSDLPPPCTDHNGGSWPAGRDYPTALAWLEVVAGADRSQAISDNGASASAVRRVLDLAPPAQAAWFEQARAAMQTCRAPS